MRLLTGVYEFNGRFFRTNRDHERVTRLPSPAVRAGLFFPLAAADRVHGDVSARCQVSSRPAPPIGVNRAARPKLRTNHPAGRVAHRASVDFLFISRGFVDPLPEIVEALLRALDPKRRPWDW